MNYLKIMALCISILCVFHVASAQTPVERPESGNSGNAIGASRIDSKFSLFDPSRFSMQQSYSLSYVSSGGHGETIGLYLNSMKYELSSSLRLNVALGWLHHPSTLFGQDDRGIDSRGTVLPNVELLYRPSEKFLFQISYESIPGVYSAYHRGLGWPYNARTGF